MDARGLYTPLVQVFFIVFVPVVVFCGSAGAVCCEQDKLLAADGAANSLFGYSVTITGDYAIVGARCDGENGEQAGAAYVFRWEDEHWIQKQKLTASDAAAGDQFGISVSADANHCVIGAPGSGDTGSAYVFGLDDESWLQQDKLITADANTAARFGTAVGMDDGIVVVGADNDDGAKSGSGAAYVFVSNGGGWTQQARLNPLDGESQDNFGNAVSICGDCIVVGVCYDNIDAGSAYVFRYDAAVWWEEAKLTALDWQPSDFFGGAVCIDGDRIIVGSHGDDAAGLNAGAAYIFEKEGSRWIQKQKLMSSDLSAGDQFGMSVAIVDNHALIGALFGAGSGEDPQDPGTAYLFHLRAADWFQKAKLLASDGEQADYFGTSVALGRDYAVVGACADGDNGPHSGSAYVFTFSPLGDLNGDWWVDFADFAVLARYWLQTPGTAAIDIAPAQADGVIDINDVGVLIRNWLRACK